jgi:ABC transporter substrate binding protein
VKRREFITLLGGAAAWPLAARAEQRERMRRIGALMAYTANDPQAQIRNAAFLQGLQQLGWIVGQSVQIDYRWSGGNIDDTRRYAAELVALAPDVIFAPGSSTLGPLLQVSRSVPIVFAIIIDPVGSGFVNSMARPGGNATGFTAFDYGIGAKWLEVLKEIAPNVTRAAVIRDPAIAAGLGMWPAIRSVSPSVAIEVPSSVWILPARHSTIPRLADQRLQSFQVPSPGKDPVADNKSRGSIDPKRAREVEVSVQQRLGRWRFNISLQAVDVESRSCRRLEHLAFVQCAASFHQPVVKGEILALLVRSKGRLGCKHRIWAEDRKLFKDYPQFRVGRYHIEQ